MALKKAPPLWSKRLQTTLTSQYIISPLLIQHLYKEMALAVGIDSEAENEAERPGEIERSSLNPSLAEKILGWKPQTSLREGVHSTLKWFESERGDNS